MSENCEGSICMSLHHHHMTHDSSVRDLIVMQAGIMSPSLIYSVGGKTDISHLKQEPISIKLIKFDNISILHQKKESDAKLYIFHPHSSSVKFNYCLGDTMLQCYTGELVITSDLVITVVKWQVIGQKNGLI